MRFVAPVLVLLAATSVAEAQWCHCLALPGASEFNCIETGATEAPCTPAEMLAAGCPSDHVCIVPASGDVMCLSFAMSTFRVGCPSPAGGCGEPLGDPAAMWDCGVLPGSGALCEAMGTCAEVLRVPMDGGSSGPDGGLSRPDGGFSGSDGGFSESDGGFSGSDGGPLDAGDPNFDAGSSPAFDAGPGSAPPGAFLFQGGGGCACRAAPSAAPAPLALLALLGLALRRR